MARDIPPIRWSADPNASPELRELVEHARGDLPDPSTIARFGAKVDAAIASHQLGPEVDLPQSAVPSSVVGGKSLTIGLGLSLSGLLAGSIWLVSRNHDALPIPEQPKPRAVEHVVLPSDALRNTTSTSPTSTSPTSTLPSSALATSAQSEATTLAPSPTKSAAESSPPVVSPSRRSASPGTGDEAKLLVAARTALTTNPALALRLTKDHARQYPNGVLLQEREVIAIEALNRSGQADAARRRAVAFEQQYPGSAHRSKIEQVLKAK